MLDRNIKDYLCAKFRASLIRSMYSPKIGIVGLWAFLCLSLVENLGSLGSDCMPKLDYILHFTAVQNLTKKIK